MNDYGNVKTPHDLKKLDVKELEGYAEYVRGKIITAVESNGGHLSSNLGTVELTIALHYVFDCPNDRLIFDVGHQCYTHKILTGRGDAFDGLRKNGGISGFPKPSESEYDAFGTGHASTSLSLALGFAEAAKRKGETRSTVAVIGDGALTGGLAYEALNAIGGEKLPLVIVLNDNEMSISKNVGAMSNYLTRLRVSKKYARLKGELKRSVSLIPFFGDGVLHFLEKGKRLLKNIVLSDKMFEAMGIGYYGPFDGHNIRELVDVFSQIKDKREPVLVHVLTDKGRGLTSAVADPAHSHGISSVEVDPAEKKFSDVLGKFLSAAAKCDERVTAVTAAMSIGTGLEAFSKEYPDRFKDVGIAEEHAVTYCAALAAAGMKPYFAVYSTFLQRGFDEILHDVCIGDHAVTLCIDRAGVVGSDGVTHQGVFDLSYLSMIPNMTVMCPTDGAELSAMLDFSLRYDKPLAIRYPKGYMTEREHSPIIYGKWEYLRKSKSKVCVLCVGPRAVEVAELASNSIDINIINARFVKPLDVEMLDELNKKGNIILTVEDNIRRGGFGEAVLSRLNSCGQLATVKIFAHDDRFIDDLDVEHSLALSGITAENLIKSIKSLV